MNKRSLTNFLLVSALMLSGATTFVSCKDYDSDAQFDQNNEWNKKFSEIVAEQDQKLQKVNDDLTALINQIKSCDCSDEATIALIEKQIKENQNVRDGIKDIANSAIDDLLNDNERLNDAISKSEAVHRLMVEIYGDENNAGLKKTLENLQNDFEGAKAGWTEKTNALSDSVKWALTLAQADSVRLDLLEQRVSNNETNITELQNQYNQLNNVTVPQLSSDLEQAKQDIIDAKGVADEALQKANALDAEMTQKISDAKDEILEQVAANYTTKDELEALKLEIVANYYDKTGIDNKFTDIEEKYNSLIAELSDVFNKLVTGVIVQGSESPITGYESTPFGVSMNVLGAYYGSADGTVDFADGTNAIERGGTLLSSSDKNSGLIFINVNPVNVDPSGIKFTLVDSQGNEAPFKLTPVNTDRVLKFGVSRAATNSNGFYALEVKLDEDKIAEAKTWTKADAQDLKDAAQNVLNKLRHPKTSALNIGDIVSSVESVFNNRLTRYGVKATWSYKANGKTVTKSTVSELNLAATAIKPLSYGFLKNGINVTVPTIPSLEEKLNLVSYKFNWTPIAGIEDMTTSVTLTIPDSQDITINGKLTPTVDLNKEFDENGLIKDVTVTVGDIDFSNATIKVGEKEKTVDIVVSMSEFNRVINDVNSQVGNMIGSVNDLIDKVNGYTETIDGQVINRVNNFIKRFNNALANANDFLQPTMLYTSQAGSWNQLPTVKQAAAYLKMNGGVAKTVFIPTSYTAELLAPAYKKYIVVKDEAGNVVNAGPNTNKVIDGNIYKIGFEVKKAGTYSITYNAVDYSGKTASRTFYVKVIE